jgi:hypothetical protein
VRRPVNSPYTITTEFGVPDSYAKFGRHSGVDYAVPLNRPIYAPVTGQLTNVVSPTGGNMAVIKDDQGFTHRLMHNNSFSRANGRVNEGEQVALAGTTGLSTGVHSHWDINREGTYPTSFASFINPADWLAGKYQPTQGADMPIPDADNYYGRYNKAMFNIRGRTMTRDEFRKNFVGRTDLQMLEAMLDNPEADRATEAQQWALANRTAVEKQIADLTVALKNEKEKPPVEVIREVEKIVTKTEIVQVPAQVDEKAVVTNWFKKIWNSLFQKG